MSKLEDSISDLGNLVRVLEARVDVRLNASRLQESTESQDLAQRRLAHLERQNMELRHRETESRAQIASWTASYTREYHSSRAHEAKLQADTYSWNRMQSFLLFKLAQAVAWNRLHYRDVIPGREFHSLGPGLVTDVKLDGGELDWTEMETWMSRFPHQVRGACGEQVVERLEELIRGFHERRYGMMPEEEYEEEWYQNEEDDDLGSGEDDEGQAEEEDDEEEEQ
ncbi:hypothetical protein LTR94_009278 [Friedmanniomyces endolithicus]|nr:hypothetical protein LTR94_009278 [Friedmanniomyces endolithicus]